MSWNCRRNSKFTNIILVINCIALIVVLGGLLLTNRKEMKQESERLQKLSEKQETGIDNYETVKEHASELKEEAGEEDSPGTADTSKQKQEAAPNKAKSSDTDKTSEEDKTSDTDKSSESKDSETQNAHKSNTASGDSEKK